MAKDTKYGDVSIPGIPDDEPVFIMRAKDSCAPQAINQYAELAIVAGSPSEFAAACRRVATQFREWQGENQDKVKTPD